MSQKNDSTTFKALIEKYHSIDRIKKVLFEIKFMVFSSELERLGKKMDVTVESRNFICQ